MEIVTENATSLAWIGDAVHSMRVREYLVRKGIQSPGRLQKLAAGFCSARGQAAVLKQMEEMDLFSLDEKEILRRGRNAHVQTTAKNADKATYMQATALEALFGYLYLYHKAERLEELLDLAVQLGDRP